jgi:predicted GTPase
MRVQKFEKLEDLEKHNCTIEEMEEYEPHINRGNIVFAGVDYHEIIKEAEKVADVILWDGGNNDTPFYNPDLHITIADPHRAGHEMKYYPGETNFRMADVIVINKIDSANMEGIEKVRENIRKVNNDAEVVDAASPIFLKGDNKIHGKKVLVVEDGPTLTHGNMKYGAGTIAARKYGAKEIIDPREFAVGKIARTFNRYPDVGKVLPAMGYDKGQMKDLEKTINKSDAEVVVIGTPIDLNRLINIKKPTMRVTYELQEIGEPTLEDILKEKIN